ncbi:MAG: hypothetical protein Q9194_003249 [Teloschistes cf. exilis]
MKTLVAPASCHLSYSRRAPAQARPSEESPKSLTLSDVGGNTARSQTHVQAIGVTMSKVPNDERPADALMKKGSISVRYKRTVSSTTHTLPNDTQW